MLESDDKKHRDTDDGTAEGESGSGAHGGQGGAIEFRDFITTRNDKLTAEEIKQLLAAHKENNQGLVEKQKKIRDQRHDRKEGKTLGQQLGAGSGGGTSSFLKHPILGEAAEFDGVDPQVNLDPTIYEAETNPEKKEELTYQHQLRHDFENQPRFNPKPSPF